MTRFLRARGSGRRASSVARVVRCFLDVQHTAAGLFQRRHQCGELGLVERNDAAVAPMGFPSVYIEPVAAHWMEVWMVQSSGQTQVGMI